MIKRVWKDPVWSKVIAVIIVFIGTTAFAKFQSYTLQINFVEAFKKLVFINVPILYIFCSILVYWLIRFFIKKMIKPSALENQKNELLKFKQWRSEDAQLLIKWEIYFDNDSPVVYNLTVFCTNHGIPPLKYVDESISIYDDNVMCPVRDCLKSQKIMSYGSTVNFIESLVIHHWDEIRK